MKSSRRDFFRTTGVICAAATSPSWVFDAATAEAIALDRNELAALAIARAKKLGVTYADIRINRYRNESIFTREERVQNVSRTQSSGFGVRVLAKGAWGFASSNVLTPKSVRRVTGQAVEIARANSLYQRKPVNMAPAPAIEARWKSAYEKDPFDVSIEDKIRFLLRLNETAMKAKGVSFVNSAVTFQNEQKYYASTDGSRIEQYIIRSHPSFTVTAVNRSAGDFQTRSSLAGPKNIGYEYLE